MTYRILLVTTDAAAGGGLQALLNRAGDSSCVVECLDRLDSAVARATAGGLDIALLDQSLSNGHALTTLELLSRIAAAVPLMLYQTPDPRQDNGQHLPAVRRLCELIPLVRLAREHARTQAILDSLSDAVVSTDLQGKVDYLNRAAQRISGWTQDKARGQPIGAVMPLVESDPNRGANPTPQAVQDNRTAAPAKSTRVLRHNGAQAFERSAAPIHDSDGQISGAVVVFHDVSVAQTIAEKMTHLAQHDVLTHLPNRLLLDDRITQALHLAKRHAGSLALMFLDLDNFKRINDSLGHAVGDKLLQSVAHRLQACVRSSDTVSRSGGDEFIVLLTEIHGEQDAAGSARKILDALAAEHCIEQLGLTITCSLGISMFPADGSSAGALLRHADSAMYQAKQAGRNRYRFFHGDAEVHEVSVEQAAGSSP